MTNHTQASETAEVPDEMQAVSDTPIAPEPVAKGGAPDGTGRGLGAWLTLRADAIAVLARTVGVCALLVLFVVPLCVLAALTLGSNFFEEDTPLLVSFSDSMGVNPLSEAEVVKLLLGFVTAAAALRGQRSRNAPELASAMAVWGLLTIALFLAFLEHYAITWAFVQSRAANYDPELRATLLLFTGEARRDLLMLFGVLLGLRSVPQ